MEQTNKSIPYYAAPIDVICQMIVLVGYLSSDSFIWISVIWQFKLNICHPTFFAEYLAPVIFTKNYQRMMVDLMFMIIQNLRLFLTVVTPTAVAPAVNHIEVY